MPGQNGTCEEEEKRGREGCIRLYPGAIPPRISMIKFEAMNRQRYYRNVHENKAGGGGRRRRQRLQKVARVMSRPIFVP